MLACRYIFASLLLCVCFAAQAHQDTILSIEPDSTVSGIPAPLAPVTLSISGLGSNAPAVEFGAGGKLTALQACAAQLIRSTSLEHVSVSGSWYHRESSLPYYVHVFFRDPISPAGIRNAGYSFVFNLHTSELIRAERTWEEPGWYKHEAIDSQCKASRTVRSNKSLERTRER